MVMNLSGRWYAGRGRGWGGRGNNGPWPGNGPFSHLPPWERPGWIYGPGSCWALGYWNPGTTPTATWQAPAYNEAEILRRQKELLESQLEAMQQTLEEITKKLDEITDRPSEE